MSHYTVMVVLGKTKVDPIVIDDAIEKALKPFDENLKVPKHVVFTMEDKRQEREREITRIKKVIAENDTKKYDIEKAKAVLQMESQTPEQYFKEAASSYDEHNKDGEPLSTYNPKSKWDWYVIGGRWSKKLITKKGNGVDFEKIKNIDFEKIAKKAIESATKSWEDAKDEKDDTTRYWKYGIEPGLTREQFIFEKRSKFSTFAVTTQDGDWHERGRMGFWAMVYDENETEDEWQQKFYERFIAPLKPEDTIVIVDCHI